MLLFCYKISQPSKLWTYWFAANSLLVEINISRDKFVGNIYPWHSFHSILVTYFVSINAAPGSFPLARLLSIKYRSWFQVARHFISSWVPPYCCFSLIDWTPYRSSSLCCLLLCVYWLNAIAVLRYGLAFAWVSNTMQHPSFCSVSNARVLIASLISRQPDRTFTCLTTRSVSNSAHRLYLLDAINQKFLLSIDAAFSTCSSTGLVSNSKCVISIDWNNIH